MDGTIIDSAYLNYYSYYNALKKFNIELDKDYYYNKCFGLHYKVFTKNILELNNKLTNDEIKDNELIESVHNLKEKIYLENLNLIQIHPFILETLIDNYNKKENKKYTALATTASPKGVYGILKEFQLEKLFDLVLTGNDVEKKYRRCDCDPDDPQAALCFEGRCFRLRCDGAVRIFRSGGCGLVEQQISRVRIQHFTDRAQVVGIGYHLVVFPAGNGLSRHVQAKGKFLLGEILLLSQLPDFFA